MSEMRTEEEQVEALKNWWKENGKSLVIAVAIALSGVFGWKAWQQKQHNDAEAASVAYQNLVDAVTIGVSQSSADDLSTGRHLADQLKAEHESTEYARFAALLMAKVAVQQEQYDIALAELDWVLNRNPIEEMRQIIYMRKARVYQATGEFEKGLDMLGHVTADEFQSASNELKGDLLRSAGRMAEARVAYQQALSESSEVRPLLTIKLEDLAVSSEG